MEQSQSTLPGAANLKIEWAGADEEESKLKGSDIAICVNGAQVYRGAYVDYVSFQTPISGDKLSIEIKIGKKEKKELHSTTNHSFKIKKDTDYTCQIDGDQEKMTGLTMSLFETDNPDNVIVHSSPIPVFILSFLFPVYALYNLTKPNNRVVGIVGAVVGYALAMILSSFVGDDEMVTLGIKSITLLEYAPFSFLDWTVNFFAGGLLSFTMILSLLFGR